MSEHLFVITFSVDIGILRVRSIIRDFKEICNKKGLNPIPNYAFVKIKSENGESTLETYQVSFKISSQRLAGMLANCMDEYVKKNPRVYYNDIVNFDTKP